MDNNNLGIMIILGIIAVALFGGAKNAQNPQFFSNTNTTTQTQEQTKTPEEIQAMEDAKNKSPYSNAVSLQYVNRGNEPKNEYVALSVSSSATTSIAISGWRLASVNSGNSVYIPKGTDLYFSGVANAVDTIRIFPGDTVYINSGNSPIGYSFRTNKCSGYLNQFQTFIPYLSSYNCPAPRNENLSAIPKYVSNDDCFDYIDSMQSCRTVTEQLPVTWSPECRSFITDKINYSSCINTHKNDKDFYQKEYRIFLNRTTKLWKDRREKVVLYDENNKIVSTLSY